MRPRAPMRHRADWFVEAPWPCSWLTTLAAPWQSTGLAPAGRLGSPLVAMTVESHLGAPVPRHRTHGPRLAASARHKGRRPRRPLYFASPPNTRPVDRFMRCVPVHAKHFTGSKTSGAAGASSANHPCTFRRVAGHRYIKVAMLDRNRSAFRPFDPDQCGSSAARKQTARTPHRQVARRLHRAKTSAATTVYDPTCGSESEPKLPDPPAESPATNNRTHQPEAMAAEMGQFPPPAPQKRSADSRPVRPCSCPASDEAGVGVLARKRDHDRHLTVIGKRRPAGNPDAFFERACGHLGSRARKSALREAGSYAQYSRAPADCEELAWRHLRVRQCRSQCWLWPTS
jgi:hypothetical protein